MGLIELINASDRGYPKRPKKKVVKSTKAKAKAEPEAEESETVAEESSRNHLKQKFLK